MKKIVVILVVSLGIYSAAFAQTKNNIEFGANAGYNVAYAEETGADISSPIVSGFNLGVSAEYYLSDRWSIRGRMIYDQKGWGNGYLIAADGSTLQNINFHLNYVTIPVMANWHFGKKRNWYLNFGAYGGFLLSASETSNDTDVKSAFNNIDFGMALGLGIKFPISENVKLFIEDEGQAGVEDIFKRSLDGTSVQSARSSLNIGIIFKLK